MTTALPLAACQVDASEAQHSGNAAIETLERVRVDARLRAMGPDGWHRIALYGNWDFVEPEVWRWIVTQPACDRATALAIFWSAQPDYYVQFATADEVSEVNRNGYALTNLIRDRWMSGRYTRSELAFDPDADVGPLDLAALRRLHGGRVDQRMPASMRVRLPGRRITDEGPALPGVIRS